MFLRRPELFHGQSIKRPFFEGWYHKMSCANGDTIVTIPGIYRSGIDDNETAFLMFYQGSSGQVDYIPYNVNDFQCDRKSYALQLGKNFFSLNEISLNFQNERINVDGKITAQNLKPWPVTLFEHGCMGWYGYVPTMECFHGILSMDHDLSGALTINDNKIDFDKGHGYIEKDWGKNFPKDWVWAQSNNFEDSKISVSVSLATIPWRKYEFSGFIIGIQHGDQLYRFTTYNFSKIAKIELKNNTLEWNLKRGNLDLELKIRPGKRSGLLYAPDKIDMIAKVEEFLDGHISLTLNQGDVTIINQSSDSAAVEIVGRTDRLIKNAV